MNQEIRKIKCPICGAILKVQYAPGVEAKTVMCPVCKKASKYNSFKQISEQNNVMEDETETDLGRNNEETQVARIGTLIQTGMGRKYELKPGRNTIGRKASTSPATIQIETNDLYMSRDHAEIVVKQNKYGEYMHIFRNSKNKNDTFVNGQKVENGDELVLYGGEIIKMANTQVRFELSRQTAHNKSNYSSDETETEL